MDAADGSRAGRSIARRIAWWGAYVVTTLLVVAILLELLVRLLGLAPQVAGQAGALVEDPHLPYRPKPSSVLEGRSGTDEYDYRHVHNADGFRDVEHARQKPGGTFRILGLGDSFTMGWGAEFNETYLRRLEIRLNGREGDHPPVEIIKAGIRGYFPESERLLLEHYGLAYDPDLVIVGFVANDLFDTYRGVDAVRVTRQGYLTTSEAENLGELFVWLYRYSHAARIPLRKLARGRARPLPPDWGEDLYREDGFFEDTWREVFAQYDAMIEMTRAAGAEIVFLHIPSLLPDGRGLGAYPGERLGAWSRERGVPFVDAFPPMSEALGTERLYWPRDRHCTPAGYRILADALFDALTTEGLVP